MRKQMMPPITPAAASLTLLLATAAGHDAAVAQTTVQAAAGAEATVMSQPRAGTAASKPISNDSVRGDVLLRMLDQAACSPVILSTGVNGGRATDAQQRQYPKAVAGVALDPSNYVNNDPQNQAGGPLNVLSTDADCAQGFGYRAAPAGSHTVHERSAPSYPSYPQYDDPSSANLVLPEHGLNVLDAQIPLTITADGFSLSETIKAETRRDRFYISDDKRQPDEPLNRWKRDWPTENLQLKMTIPLSVKLTSEIPYGMLAVWKDDKKHDYRLMLLKGNEGEAKLCWNANLDAARRLHCSTWSVPAGWKRGQTIKLLDQYVIEDRTSFKDEKGLIYYTSKAKGQ